MARPKVVKTAEEARAVPLHLPIQVEIPDIRWRLVAITEEVYRAMKSRDRLDLLTHSVDTDTLAHLKNSKAPD